MTVKSLKSDNSRTALCSDQWWECGLGVVIKTLIHNQLIICKASLAHSWAGWDELCALDVEQGQASYDSVIPCHDIFSR